MKLFFICAVENPFIYNALRRNVITTLQSMLIENLSIWEIFGRGTAMQQLLHGSRAAAWPL
jgi:hypothetical protein